jgi:undecaprenyl-diphosphatase
MDDAVLLGLAKLRSPWLNRFMVDITSLGSMTIVFLISIAAFALLWIVQDRRGAVRIAVAAGGSEISIEVLKRIFGRPRPAVVPYLAQFTGWSFPSGHALMATAMYATLAVVICAHMRDRRGRMVIRLMCVAIVILVSISRMYLGVHYPSDVAAGILLGLLWFYLTPSLTRGSKQHGL